MNNPDAARAALRAARHVAVLTGAGVSAESGVATFRGPGGLWRNHNPSELATPGAFQRDPVLVWQWYSERRDKLRAIEPNAAHRALAGLQKRLEENGRKFSLITQNVDRLHQKAGSRDVIELHGSIWTVQCTACPAVRDDDHADYSDAAPRCESCGALMRPGVVWFGETLPHDQLTRAIAAIHACQVLLVIGTSSVVYPAAGLAFEVLQLGGTVIEVNLEATPLSRFAQFVFARPAGEIVPPLVEGA